LQEELDRLRSIKSDDFFIPSGDNIKGIRDLQEELKRLRSIKSDDAFIDGLRDIQEELALLRSIKIEEESMHSVTVDQVAYPPKNRIKPNRRLIVSLGTVVGLFLGIFLVFFVSFIQKQKETHSV
jgi:LPS O-antigen subunit length determinant protein (WzzB/FepE family)